MFLPELQAGGTPLDAALARAPSSALPSAPAQAAAQGGGSAAGPPTEAEGGPPEPLAEETALGAGAEGGAGAAGVGTAGVGRWRLSITVPSAQLQDALPATQLISATTRPGRDYGAAKAAFLTALPEAAFGQGPDEPISRMVSGGWVQVRYRFV